MSKSYYEILGLPRDATEAQIKNAYHKLALKFHPDKAGNPAEAAEMEERFSQISTAYNVLKDRDKRQAYDATLDKSRKSDSGVGSTTPKPGSSSDSGVKRSVSGAGAGAAALERNRDAVAKRALKRGLQLMQIGEYAKAAEFFETAIANGGNEAIYYGKLAQTLLRGHRGFTRATEAAKKAIELDPYNSEYRLTLAELYEAVDSQSKAIETYEEILKWDPTNLRAQDRLNALQPKKATLKDHILKFLGRK